jgi:hypothetical protein
MFDLFKNEFKRFQLPALIIMFVHLAVWGFIYTQKPILQNNVIQSSILNLFMILSGLLFGVMQIFLHRRKNNWAYLMHRPLSAANIHKSLIGAGSLLLIIAVVLPFALVLVSLDLFSTEPVELRHYLFILHMTAITLSCYLLGTYTVLSPNKAAFLTIGIVLFMTSSNHSSAGSTLETDLVVTLILFVLSRLSFKANLSQPFTKKTEIFLAALVLQPALAFIVTFSQVLYYHAPMMLLEIHPDQATKEQSAGYFNTLWLMENDEAVEMILENSEQSKHDEIYASKEYREQLVSQVKLATSDMINGGASSSPVRGELFHKDKSYALNDNANNKQWIFSHTKMVFEGRDTKTGKLVGYLSLAGFLDEDAVLTDAVRFKAIPRLSSNQYVQTKDTVYGVDFDEQLMEIKHQLNKGEIYQSNIMFRSETSVVILLSEKMMYFFEPAEFAEDNIYTEPSHAVTHPLPLGDDVTIRYTALIDGYLVEYRSSQVFRF